jgi:hypothetical protein
MNNKSRIRQRYIFAFLAICALILACSRSSETSQPPSTISQPSSSTSQPPSSDSGQAQSGNVLFQDDFQDGQPQEWKINSGWNVEQSGDTYLFGSSVQGGAWVTEGGGWQDYTFETDARVDTGNLLLSINLSKDGRYALRLGTDGVYLLREQPADSYDVIVSAGPISGGDWHHISLASQAGRLQVWVDRVLWFDTTDTAPILKGTISVGSLDGSRVFVDNVLVTKNQSTLPAGVVQAPPPLNNAPSEAEIVEEQGSSSSSGDVETVEEPTSPPSVGGGQPDLVVSEVTFNPSIAIQGQPFTTNYLIENRGDAEAGAFTFRLHFHASAGIADCNMDVTSLAPGLSTWGGCVRTINGNTGNYPVEATVDLENEIPESDEGNNQTALTLKVAITDSGGEMGSDAGGGLPDLVVSDVSFAPSPVIKGQPFTASYVIKNQGSANAGIFTFRLHFHDSAGIADCNMDVNSLGPGQQVVSDCTRTINGNTGNYPVKATVDVESEIPESDEGNNEFSTKVTVAE